MHNSEYNLDNEENRFLMILWFFYEKFLFFFVKEINKKN